MSGANGTAGTNAEAGTHIFDKAYCLSNTDPNIDQSTFVNMPWSNSFFCTGKPDFDGDSLTQVTVDEGLHKHF